MSELANQTTAVSEKKKRDLKSLIKDPVVQEKFKEILGKNSSAFLMSVLNSTQNSPQLVEAEPQSILMASAVAATLNLPIDPNLGMAYLIPFKDKRRNNQTFAQFQLGYKGFIALCHRTGQFSRINVEVVYEGEIKYIDRLSGDISFEWIQDQDERKKRKMVGVVAFFKLNNGFEKTFFMTEAELEAHGKKYSQSYKANFGLWKDDPISMKKKTVLKLLLEKYAPKSVELMQAIKTDQSVVDDYNGDKVHYPDNEPIDLDELNAKAERQRIIDFIKNSTTLEQLEQVYESVPDEEIGLMYVEKREQLKNK